MFDVDFRVSVQGTLLNVAFCRPESQVNKNDKWKVGRIKNELEFTPPLYPTSRFRAGNDVVRFCKLCGWYSMEEPLSQNIADPKLS